MKNVALFDWDKTIRSGGYVLFDFIDILVRGNIFDKNIVYEIDTILREHSEGRETYTEFAKKTIRIYGKYINGISVQALEPALAEFERMENENNRIYPIMEQKVFPFLLKNGIEPIIISGSPQEPLDLYKKRMGFKRAYAIQFKMQDGKYTEDCILNIAIGDGKRAVVKEILQREPKTRILFAFGDSEADIPMLDMVL